MKNEELTDVMAMVCGKRFVLSRWIQYLEQIPAQIPTGELIVVDNSNDCKYSAEVAHAISSSDIKKLYTRVSVVYGDGAYVPPPGVSWRDPSVNVNKHESTAHALNIGLARCHSKYVLTVDDDTFIRDDGVKRLYQQIVNNSRAGAITGMYFSKPFWDRDSNMHPHAHRALVLSMCAERWVTCYVDDVYDSGTIEAGHCGTGAVIWRTSMIKHALPLFSESAPNGGCKGPDGVLCDRLRSQGYELLVDTTVEADHLHKLDHHAGIGWEVFHKQRQQSRRLVMASVAMHGTKHNILETVQHVQQVASHYDCDGVVLIPSRGDQKLDQQLRDMGIGQTQVRIISDWNTRLERHIREGGNSYRKFMSELYYEQLNSGDYGEIINLMNTAMWPRDINQLKQVKREGLLLDVQVRDTGLIGTKPIRSRTVTRHSRTSRRNRPRS